MAGRQHHHVRPRRRTAVDLPQLGAEPRRRRMPRHVGRARRDARRRIQLARTARAVGAGRPRGDAFTTITHWWEGWMYFEGEEYPNDKRTSFLEFIDVPRLSGIPLELATQLEDEDDRVLLERSGWRLRDAGSLERPSSYRDYVRGSRGEFSCAKPSCMHLQNAWISDRTICYLASGRPAVVQHTGPSRFLPDAAGLFRFRTVEEAARALETVAADYERQSRLARALAEEHFDARTVVGRVLERAVT